MHSAQDGPDRQASAGSPAARAKLKQPVAAANRPEEEGSVDAEPKVDLGSPTVWALAADGLVRPVAVKVGMSDGMVTEITDGDLEPGDEVVVHEVREVQPDFVSSFVSYVTDAKK